MVNLLALCLNLVLLPLVSSTPGLPLLLFLLLAAVHIYSNYRAVSCLVFPTLNLARLNILLDSYLAEGLTGLAGPAQVNLQEPVVRPGRPGRVTVHLGESIASLASPQLEKVAAAVEQEKPYLVTSQTDTECRVLLTRDLLTSKTSFRTMMKMRFDVKSTTCALCIVGSSKLKRLSFS